MKVPVPSASQGNTGVRIVLQVRPVATNNPPLPESSRIELALVRQGRIFVDAMAMVMENVQSTVQCDGNSVPNNFGVCEPVATVAPPRTTPRPTANPARHGTSSKGKVAGIAMGLAVGLIVAVAVVALVRRRRHQQSVNYSRLENIADGDDDGDGPAAGAPPTTGHVQMDPVHYVSGMGSETADDEDDDELLGGGGSSVPSSNLFHGFSRHDPQADATPLYNDPEEEDDELID